MNEKELISLANECGIGDKYLSDENSVVTDYGDSTANVLLFAASVSLSERESCAMVCEAEADNMEEFAQRAIKNGEHDEVSAIRIAALKLRVVANRIRSRRGGLGENEE